MTRLGDDTPVHQGGRAAFDYMVGLVHELAALPDEASARRALGAFIAVRMLHQPRYADFQGQGSIRPESLAQLIAAFVADNSEGGRRAQAVVAGLMDVFAGPGRVESGRINDPSRKYPGDVCVRSLGEDGVWQKAIEVRDKAVGLSDVHIFARKCVEMGVPEAAVVMASPRQERLPAGALSVWTKDYGIGLTLFYGWELFVDQALFWSEAHKPVAAGMAVRHIHERLKQVEASEEALLLWQRLIDEAIAS